MSHWHIKLLAFLALMSADSRFPCFEAAAADLDRSQGRSMVISAGGIVAAEHPLAAQAGAMILASGGTAIDAAVAANAAMSVFSPMMCGPGGDLFALVYDAKSGRVYGLNASGWSPRDLTLDQLRNEGLTSIGPDSVHSITVPGAVDGWAKLLERFGTKSFKDVLAPAIHFAETGFPVTELVAGYWRGQESKLRKFPASEQTFLPHQRVPALGEVFRNPDLAWTFRQIAAHGPAAFYSGAVADRILKFTSAQGNRLHKEDFREFSSEWVEPISTTYRGWRVYEIPPNGQGIAALGMLNLMEQFGVAKLGHNSAETLHRFIEAKKLAYADMLQHVADTRFASVPAAAILSKKYAAERAKLIRDRAQCAPEPGNLPIGADTTYLCAVDREGNMISLIQSVYYLFGSGAVAPGTGFVLQNRGALFTLDPAHPNALEPRKRPLHTIIPGFMEKGNTRAAFGIMGGWNQSQAHAQFVSNVADHGLNIQAALEAARFTKATFPGCDVQIEGRVAESVRAELERRGHDLELLGDFSQAVGGGQAVLRDFDAGINYGGSDPRKDGAAIPEPWVPGSSHP